MGMSGHEPLREYQTSPWETMNAQNQTALQNFYGVKPIIDAEFTVVADPAEYKTSPTGPKVTPSDG